MKPYYFGYIESTIDGIETRYKLAIKMYSRLFSFRRLYKLPNEIDLRTDIYESLDGKVMIGFYKLRFMSSFRLGLNTIFPLFVDQEDRHLSRIELWMSYLLRFTM